MINTHAQFHDEMDSKLFIYYRRRRSKYVHFHIALILSEMTRQRWPKFTDALYTAMKKMVELTCQCILKVALPLFQHQRKRSIDCIAHAAFGDNTLSVIDDMLVECAHHMLV